MRRSMKAATDMFKVFILFSGFTILFYCAMMWINSEYRDYHRYDPPEGSAIKVTTMEEENHSRWFDRLMFFYLNGE